MDFNRMFNGIMRAIRLDTSFYNEVENDPSYQREALGVVLLVAVLSGIGSFLGGLIGGSVTVAVTGLLVSLVMGVVGYYIWSFMTHFIGTRFFNGQGDLGEVQRALGFAYSPQLLSAFAWIPCIGWVLALGALILSIATGFIATRESLDQTDGNALLTMIIATVILGIVGAIVGAIFGVGVAATAGVFGAF